ncbi:hypothetical protein EV175_000105 [Coemansia sp. RSA 1933]|nr:hypothetical protein EV175_000105 [Coemansia sp. RSA 1933]
MLYYLSKPVNGLYDVWSKFTQKIILTGLTEEQLQEFRKMKFMLSLIDTVDYLRSQNYIHADLYEGNIMVLKEDPSTSYLIDFDAAEPVATEMIETTKSFGLPRYDYIAYGCDNMSSVRVFKLPFKQSDNEAPSA